MTDVRTSLLTLALGAAAIAVFDATMADIYRSRYIRADATARDFYRDKWDCDRDLGKLSPGWQATATVQRTYVQTGVYEDDLTRCLGVKGWRPAAGAGS